MTGATQSRITVRNMNGWTKARSIHVEACTRDHSSMLCFQRLKYIDVRELYTNSEYLYPVPAIQQARKTGSQPEVLGERREILT